MKIYTYIVFDLKVSSEIELPELTKSNHKSHDVYLQIGKVPDKLPNPITSGLLYQAAEDDFLLRMENIGAFRVQKGSLITIEPNPICAPSLLRVFLLGSVFGALLHQKDILALHGSSVSFDGQAIIILGQSSTGKSTLAASLNELGCQHIADDLSALYPKDDGFKVAPGIPQIKLWGDVLSKLHVKDSELHQIRTNVEKYVKNIKESHVAKPITVSKIVVLSSKNSPGIEITEIKGGGKFEVLTANTYRYQFLKGLGKSNSHFSSISKLAGACRMFQIKRPSSPLLIDELTKEVIDLIIKDS